MIVLTLTLWRPLLPCWIIGLAIKHPVPDQVDVICNFWHLGTLAVRAERQSAQISKITNDCLLNPVWQGLLYNSHMATLCVKGFPVSIQSSGEDFMKHWWPWQQVWRSSLVIVLSQRRETCLDLWSCWHSFQCHGCVVRWVAAIQTQSGNRVTSVQLGAVCTPCVDKKRGPFWNLVNEKVFLLSCGWWILPIHYFSHVTNTGGFGSVTIQDGSEPPSWNIPRGHISAMGHHIHFYYVLG